MTDRLGDHCGRLLADLAHLDTRIRVLDGDLADSDGAVHFARSHPDRFYMGGIAEQSLVAVAAGMASCGLRPFVFSFAAFLCYRAYDQIRVCLSQARQPVVLVGSHSGGCSGRNGKTHAAVNDIGLMAALPHFDVWAPGDISDVALAVRTVLAGDNPAYIRLPRSAPRELAGDAAECRWVGPPGEVALLSAGFGSSLAVQARDILLARGVPAGVLHCPRLAPLPVADLAASLAGVRRLFVVEDHSVWGGLASLLRHELPALPLTILGWPATWPGESGGDADLLHAYRLDGPGLAQRVAEGIS